MSKRILVPLAEEIGDEEYADELRRRIGAAQAAQADLNLEALQAAN